MEEKLKYYLVDGWVSADPEKKLKSRLRIAAFPDGFPYIPKKLHGHDSTRHLRRYEKRWKELKSKSSKTADKICDDRFILYCHDVIITPMDKKFNNYSIDLLQHSVHGKYENDFSGLHLYSKLNKDISKVEETKPEDKNGVWEAKIYLYNARRNKTYEKVSTLFPKHWTPTHFMFEVYAAIENISINAKISEYKTTTLTGVPVIVIIENSIAKTIYPVYSE